MGRVISTGGTELCCPREKVTARTVRPTVQAMLEQFEPAPAFVINHLADLLAWNDGYDRLVRPLGILVSERAPQEVGLVAVEDS
ncbi:MAG TPA: transcriptional regulator, partial [Pseudonocardiaceae bacterium]|nr:transcriptional regulator [Pseudonocardiaceae bacterium]